MSQPARQSVFRLLVLDVDGVLTRGEVAPGAEGDRGKVFHVRDGHAIKLWQRAGGIVALLSGRQSPDVTRRADELGIRHVRQNIANKLEAFRAILSETGCSGQEAVFVGDDLPDVPVMRDCGLAIAVADAAAETKRAAHLVTRRPGGQGAAAEAIEWVLRKDARWDRAKLYTV